MVTPMVERDLPRVAALYYLTKSLPLSSGELVVLMRHQVCSSRSPVIIRLCAQPSTEVIQMLSLRTGVLVFSITLASKPTLKSRIVHLEIGERCGSRTSSSKSHLAHPFQRCCCISCQLDRRAALLDGHVMVRLGLENGTVQSPLWSEELMIMTWVMPPAIPSGCLQTSLQSNSKELEGPIPLLASLSRGPEIKQPCAQPPMGGTQMTFSRMCVLVFSPSQASKSTLKSEMSRLEGGERCGSRTSNLRFPQRGHL